MNTVRTLVQAAVSHHHSGHHNSRSFAVRRAHWRAARKGLRCETSAAGAAAMPSEEPEAAAAQSEASQTAPAAAAAREQQPDGGVTAWWRRQQEKSAALRKKLLALGPAAVLAYGLFDGLTYSVAFAIAFLGYEAKTGLNPTQNVADLVKICILMWAGNNVTRPLRLAGAAALAPVMDRLMDSLQRRFKLPNKALAFAAIVIIVAGACFSVVGALFFSRWVQG